MASLVERARRAAKRRVMRLYPRFRPLLPDRYFAYRTPAGRIYLNVKESPMMFARALGLYEVEKHRALAAFLREGMTFVDVGANKGDFALFAARLLGPPGRVLAVEPEPENCTWLRRSVARNGYANVEVIEGALSDRDGRAELHLGEKSGWHSLVGARAGEDRGTLTVETLTLDSLVTARGLERVDGVKIDVEGAEALVLRGAEETIRGNEAIVLFLDFHPQRGVDVDELEGLLSALGLRTFSVLDPSRPVGLRDATDVIARRG